MNDRVFVDANVFIYARDASEDVKQTKADRWIRSLWTSGNGRLSIQVLQEFYVTVTQKLQPGMSRKLARQDVRNLMSWQPVTPDLGLLESAWALQDRYNLPWWDAPIVAAALQAGCGYLLSEDFQDGMVFDEVTVVNPFERGYESVLERGGPETRPKES